MVRTQIQLTEEQSAVLKEIAHAEGVSVAEVIRRGLDLYIASAGAVDDDERRRRALAVAGRFGSGTGDLASRHDDYLPEAFAE